MPTQRKMTLTKKVIFNLPIVLVEKLQKIPRGKRSQFVAESLERQLRIYKRMEMIEFLRNIQNSSDFDLIFMNITQGFLMKLDEDLEFQKKVIENIKQLLSAKRKELVKISQDKKIIEKLKENEYEAYVKMMDKKENLFLDDMSSKLYNKKINSNKAYGK